MIRKANVAALGVCLRIILSAARAGLAAVLWLAGSSITWAQPFASVQPEPQHVWLHYDYMVFPEGWTSLAGIKYPHGLSMAPSEKAIDAVVDAFAAQGLTLHIDPHHEAVPGHQVLIPDFYPDWTNPSKVCVGPDAVSFMALKKQYFRPLGNHPWHYAIFAFNGGTPDTSLDGSLCPLALDGPASGPIDPSASGLSELPGFNFLLSFGYYFDLLGSQPDDYSVGGTFMHELGHNFGLQHGGVLGYPEEVWNYKPNYISVMNYAYQDGIRYAAAFGSITPRGVRLDYSRAALDPLNEADLNEFAGVHTWSTDIVVNFNTASGCLVSHTLSVGPALGPIDWNCNGTLEFHATADVNNDTSRTILHGFDDWTYVKQQLEISPDVIGQMPKKMRYESGPTGRRAQNR